MKHNQLRRPRWLAFLSILNCLLVILPSSVDAQRDSASTKKTKIAWQFKKGDQFSLMLDQLSQTQSIVLERKVKIRVRVKMHVSWSVEGLEGPGKARIRQTIDWVTLDTTNTNPDGVIQTVAIDSRREPSEEASRKSRQIAERIQNDIKPILEKPVFFQLDQNGKLGSFEIPKETQDAIRNAKAAMQLRQLFTSEGMARVLGPSAVEWPQNEIALNESWNSIRELKSNLGDFNQTFEFKLEKLEGDLASIGVVSTTTEEKQDEDKKVEQEDGLKIIEQSGQGKISFHVTEGYLTTSQFTTMVKTKRKIRPDVEIEMTTRDEVMIEIEKK